MPSPLSDFTCDDNNSASLHRLMVSYKCLLKKQWLVMNDTGFLAYLFQLFYWTFSNFCRQKLIINSFIQVLLLPVDFMDSYEYLHIDLDLFSIENLNSFPLHNDIRFSFEISGSENNMRIIHNSIVKILISLETLTECAFLVSSFRRQEWNCFQGIF